MFLFFTLVKIVYVFGSASRMVLKTFKTLKQIDKIFIRKCKLSSHAFKRNHLNWFIVCKSEF